MSGELTATNIQVIAQRLHHQDSAVPNSKYTLLTKFRARQMPFNPGFRLQWDGVDIRTAYHLPRWMHLEQFFFNGIGTIYPHEPQFYGHLILSCTERHEEIAVSRMLDSIKVVMGLFNLFAVGRAPTYRLGRPVAPGALWLGPYQFLFKGRRSLSKTHLWYTPVFDERSWNDGPLDMAKVLQIIPSVRKALTALENHPLKDILTKAVSISQDAFESHESNYRLLRYWSALEKIYVEDDGRERSNQKVISRAAFAEQDPRLARWTLSHISRLRNDYVHAGTNEHDLDVFGQHLKTILYRHIVHWIFTGHTFENQRALLDYVDLPGDAEALSKMRAAIDRRLELTRQMGADE